MFAFLFTLRTIQWHIYIAKCNLHHLQNQMFKSGTCRPGVIERNQHRTYKTLAKSHVEMSGKLKLNIVNERNKVSLGLGIGEKTLIVLLRSTNARF